MTTLVVEQFTSNTERSRRLADLMGMCQAGYRIVTVLVAGAGDAFITKYWPKLQQLVNRGRIKLTVADKKPIEALMEEKLRLAQVSGERKNIEALRSLYGGFLRMLKEQPRDVWYLNMEDPGDQSRYYHLTQDIVFVLVPDDIHIEYASHWLRRATLVVVEKPYNRNLVEAQQFQEELAKMVDVRGNVPHTFVVCIDHYLAKIFRYVMCRHEETLERQIGVIRKIEFSICEAGGVEPWRAASLDAGMVYDLFCHVLAQISPFVDLATLLHRGTGREILIARHEKTPPGFNAESYASIRADLRDSNQHPVTIAGCVGKGVGKADRKFLEIAGEKGTLIGDFGPQSDGKISVVEPSGTRRPFFDIGKGHPEMLDAIFEGRFMQEPVGGLTGETAILILQILDSIRTEIQRSIRKITETQGSYPVGAEPEEIDKVAIRSE